MSEKKQTKTNTAKWDKSQRIGFWVLLLSLALFWGGVSVGTQATLNSIAEKEQIKTQAVEDYKASLKNNQ